VDVKVCAGELECAVLVGVEGGGVVVVTTCFKGAGVGAGS